MMKRVMVIDDEASIRLSLEEGLMDFGYDVMTVESLKMADIALTEYRPHVVILDLRLKDGSGLEYIENIKRVDADIYVIMITAYGDIETAVHAMKKGAFEFVTKPFDLDEIEVLMERAFEQLKLNQKLRILEEREKESILTSDAQMKILLENTRVIAAEDDITVLITGETGTGKELMADYIHLHSPRKQMPMVKINCASIPKDLFESELFGHEKHAFTGAGNLKKGLLELADGGTVFLDEVGEIPMDQQAKLLRFLEGRQLKRLGGTQNIDINLRVLAATNRDLWAMVNKGLFRADLYYRLNVVPIKLMPLRERQSDIQLLAEHFMVNYNKKFNKRFIGFTEDTTQRMKTYSWPGNIRELRNFIERACIVQHGNQIDSSDFPAFSETLNPTEGSQQTFDFLLQLEQGRPLDLPELLLDIEKECIDKALEMCHDNQSQAAKLLNMSRFALKRRLDKIEE